MNSINQTNYEEWFFNYFEGFLSNEEKEKMLDFIEKDPIYREEFEFWEKTYIREPLPSKLPIESNLLRKESSLFNKYRLVGGLAILLAGVFMLWHQTPSEERISLPKNKIEREAIAPSSIQERTESTTETGIKVKPSSSTGKNIVAAENTVERQDGNIEAMDWSLISPGNDSVVLVNHIQPMPVRQELILPGEQAHHAAKEVKANTSTKKLSKADRKRLHKIEKLKQKAQQEREAQRLLKGGEPYVIPTNPNF